MVEDEYIFCLYCGVRARPFPGGAFTGFELLRGTQTIRIYWLRRLVAFIIDVTMIYLLVTVTLELIVIPIIGGAPLSALTLSLAISPLLSLADILPLITLAYFIIIEANYNLTVGKLLMGVRVVKLKGGKLGFKTSLLVNISKINILLVLLDVVTGLRLRGDGRQKYMDTRLNVKVEETARIPG